MRQRKRWAEEVAEAEVAGAVGADVTGKCNGITT